MDSVNIGHSETLVKYPNNNKNIYALVKSVFKIIHCIRKTKNETVMTTVATTAAITKTPVSGVHSERKNGMI